MFVNNCVTSNNTKPSAKIILIFCLCCVLIFCISFSVFKKNNDFSAIFHPDEPNKVDIVLNKSYKFYHPLLLLQPVIIYNRVTGVSDYLKVTVAGRTTSAMYCALAVVCFMIFIMRVYGFRASLMAGLILSFCPMLSVYAHYFKEDSALIFGLSLFFLSLRIFEEKKNFASLVFLSLGNATAISGKYAGSIVLIFAIVFIFFHNQNKESVKKKFKYAGLYLLFCLLFTIVINFQIFYYFTTFLNGVSAETNHITTNHMGVRNRLFSSFYPRVIFSEVPIPIHFFAMVYFLSLIRTTILSKKVSSELLFFIYVILYTMILMATPMQNSRYILPVVVYFFIAGISGLAVSFNWLKGRFTLKETSIEAPPDITRIITLLHIFVFFAIASMPFFCTLNYLNQFKDDSRYRLEKWADTHIPAGAKVGADYYALLHRNKDTFDERKLKYQCLQMKFFGLMGTVEDAKLQGFDYVVICDMSYGRFLEQTSYVVEEKKTNLSLCKSFYDDLIKNGKMVWSAIPSRRINGYTNPEIRVYQLREDKNTTGTLATSNATSNISR